MARQLAPIADIAALKALVKHREGDEVLVESVGDVFIYDSGSVAANDDHANIRPTNFAAAGVWIKRVEGSTQLGGIQSLRVTITSAEVLALNATPITLVPAPGVGLANVFEGAVCHKAAGVAYAGIAAGEDLGIKYTGAAGLEVAALEMTGFADSVAVQSRYIRPRVIAQAAGAPSELLMVENAVLAAHMLVGEIITGDSDFDWEIYFRIVPTVL